MSLGLPFVQDLSRKRPVSRAPSHPPAQWYLTQKAFSGPIGVSSGPSCAVKSALPRFLDGTGPEGSMVSLTLSPWPFSLPFAGFCSV